MNVTPEQRWNALLTARDELRSTEGQLPTRAAEKIARAIATLDAVVTKYVRTPVTAMGAITKDQAEAVRFIAWGGFLNPLAATASVAAGASSGAIVGAASRAASGLVAEALPLAAAAAPVIRRGLSRALVWLGVGAAGYAVLRGAGEHLVGPIIGKAFPWLVVLAVAVFILRRRAAPERV